MALGDLRFAVRSLLKRPGFTLVAVATIALGIGANTAIFTVVYAVLLRPLPYRDANRVVRVRGANLVTRQPGNLSPMDFLDLRARTRRFERLAAYNNYADATLTGAGEPERIAGTRVTSDFLAALGTSPALGRDFSREDDVPGAAPVAILTHGFWQRRFAADPAIVGRSIHLNSVATEVIGVLPAWFRHPLPENAREPDVFVPIRIDPKENLRSGHYLQAVGLLKPGVTVADGEADMVSIAADLEREYPTTNTGRSVTIEPLLAAIVGDTRRVLLTLLGTVGFVFLIACTNLANLLLARSAARRREIAVRQALGATRVQLVRQMLTETTVLACAGGACGVLIARWAVRLLAVIGVDRIPRGDTMAIDAPVLAFALGLSLLAGIVFGIGPALAATRRDVQSGLRDGGRGEAARVHPRAQQALVVSEIALALMLLVGAGLFVKSLWRLERVDPGFQADHVLTLRTSLPLARYPEGDEIPFYQRVVDRLAALAPVRAVGAINILPLSSDYSCDGFEIEGRRPAAPGREPCAEHRSVTPGYFDAMGIARLRGRTFTREDVEGSMPVVVVSANMARTFWPETDAVGARIKYQGTARTVVGVVSGVRHFGLDRDAPFEMYTPHAQQPSYHTMTLVIRGRGVRGAGSGFFGFLTRYPALETSETAVALMPSIRRELWAIDRDVPISAVRTLDQVVSDSTEAPRFRTVLLTTFAALALVLAIVGVAGVIGHGVSRRTQEIGVRVALGATTGRVVATIVAEGLRPTLVGILIGTGGALAIARVVSGLLFDVAPADPAVLAISAATLAIASLAAAWLPARRAARVDPMIALRAD